MNEWILELPLVNSYMSTHSFIYSFSNTLIWLTLDLYQRMLFAWTYCNVHIHVQIFENFHLLNSWNHFKIKFWIESFERKLQNLTFLQKNMVSYTLVHIFSHNASCNMMKTLQDTIKIYIFGFLWWWWEGGGRRDLFYHFCSKMYSVVFTWAI